MDETYDFKHSSGEPLTTKIKGEDVKVGVVIMTKDRPCEVTSLSTQKSGKHGAAKMWITGMDIFTREHYEAAYSQSDTQDEVITKRKEYQVMDVKENGFLTLMSEDGETRDDLSLPSKEVFPEAHQRITLGFKEGTPIKATVLSAVGHEAIVYADMA